VEDQAADHLINMWDEHRAIIASLIALGYSIDEIHALYKAHVPAVMRERSSAAKTAALAKLSSEVFGTRTFSEVLTGVGIVTTRWITAAGICLIM
jgi:uncharacterized protein